MKFFTSDLHFSHRNILKYTPRPWSTVEEMNEALIENCNSLVGKKDELWILGDFAFNDHNKWIMRLRGCKTLIAGSHDSASQDVLKNFSNVYDKWDLKLKNGRFAHLEHECCRIWERSHYGTVHLFGHSHGRLKTFNLSFDVGVDTNDFANKYFPVSEDEIIKKVEEREEFMRAEGRIIQENGKTLYRQDDVAWLYYKLHPEEKPAVNRKGEVAV